jgi:hypothetical protein
MISSESNGHVSILDAEELEYLPAKTLLRLVEQAQKAKKHAALFQLTVKAYPDLFRRLEELDIEPDFCVRSGDINLNFSGDGLKLAEVWKVLRRAGYKTELHPKKGESTFYTYWKQEGFATFWMNFSSSVCRRVQVGTKMVETPIYETQCGELPDMIEAPGTAVVTAEEMSNDIPF